VGSIPIGGIYFIEVIMSRPYTADEGFEAFLQTVAGIAEYWAKESHATSPLDRCNGVAFSILSLIDGCNIALPAIRLLMDPHSTDKEYHELHGENWWPKDLDITENNSLHELYHKYAKRD
jgi:hypothetical protein